jgi:ABC-type lipoprotein export system ATPase subunit
MSNVQRSRSKVDSSLLASKPVGALTHWTSNELLRVSDLRKSFLSSAGESVDVLRGIDFQAATGEMVAITGPSGSGKTTLLQLLGGLEAPSHGTIFLNQVNLGQINESALAKFRRDNIGFVFQFHHLLADLTAEENIVLPLLIARRPGRKAKMQAVRALETVGLSGKASLPVGHLSGGEQQKVAVARALIGEPFLILADEPTGNLDSAQGEEIASLLNNYCRSRPALVIVATHNRSLGQICDRVMGIQDGKLRPESFTGSEKSEALRL